MYDHEQISLGVAARIAGVSYSEMIAELGGRDIAVIRMQPGEPGRSLVLVRTETGRRMIREAWLLLLPPEEPKLEMMRD